MLDLASAAMCCRTTAKRYASLYDGTAWEVGYAYARGKTIIGLHTDWRMRFEHEVVNLMLEYSIDHLARSLEELRELLVGLRTAH